MADTVETRQETGQGDTGVPISEAAEKFASAIANTGAYREYIAAYEALQGDTEAKALFSEHQRRSRYVQMAAQWGGEREQDRAAIEQLERQMNDNATIARYRESQRRLIEELRELNEFMASELGFDPAAMARPHSCGCG